MDTLTLPTWSPEQIRKAKLLGTLHRSHPPNTLPPEIAAEIASLQTELHSSLGEDGLELLRECLDLPDDIRDFFEENDDESVKGYTPENREKFLQQREEWVRDGIVNPLPREVIEKHLNLYAIRKTDPRLWEFYELMVKRGEQTEYALIAASGWSQATVNRRLNTLKELGLVQFKPPVPAVWKASE